MFTEGDVSKADEVCDPNVKVHSLLVSSETKGLDAWKNSLKGIFDGKHFGFQVFTAPLVLILPCPPVFML